jgi:hypothetical protein
MSAMVSGFVDEKRTSWPPSHLFSGHYRTNCSNIELSTASWRLRMAQMSWWRQTPRHVSRGMKSTPALAGGMASARAEAPPHEHGRLGRGANQVRRSDGVLVGPIASSEPDGLLGRSRRRLLRNRRPVATLRQAASEMTSPRSDMMKREDQSWALFDSR